MGSELTNSMQESAVGGREEDTNEVRDAAPGSEGRKLAQPMAAAGGCRRACALGVPELQAGGWGRGASWNAAELQPPPQLPPQRRGHVVWCVGRGEEEEGGKPSEETGETPHTAQDGRRGSSKPSCQAACRGPWAQRCAGSATPASRRALGERGGRARMRELAAGAPGEAGPTTPVAPLRQRQRRCW